MWHRRSKQRPFDIVDDSNGFPRVLLSEPDGSSAEVLLCGGQIVSWKNQHGEELLFMSSKAMPKSPKSIRGGISVCLPQIGRSGSLENLGLTRNKLWSLDNCPSHMASNGNQSLVDLILNPVGKDLKTLPCGSEVRVEGLETLDYNDNLLHKERFTEQADAVTFDGEVDRVYLGAVANIAIIDHGKKRTIVLRKNGLPDAVVWNPWDKTSKALADFGDEDYKNMLNVDSAAVEKPIVLKPLEEWKGYEELSIISSSYCSGQLDPQCSGQLDPQRVLYAFR